MAPGRGEEYPDALLGHRGSVRGVVWDVGNATEGQDLQAVKTAEDGGRIEAWWKLVQTRAPRSMSRAVRKVEADIQKWEGHQRPLANEFQETFSGTVNVGILLHILPKQAHDFVPQAL